MKWLLGLDDTDVPDSRGTGSLARALGDALAPLRARARGVTRHQLLVHPSVPYTTHNSANCLELDMPGGGEAEIFAWACRFVEERSPDGSDPGVCLAEAAALGEVVADFGRRAQREVLRRQEAEDLAAAQGCRLAGLKGTRDGVIGALAAVGLRAGGNDGRFVALGGIRDLPDTARVRDILDAGVDMVTSGDGDEPHPDQWVATLGWARPRLIGGRAVLIVQRSNDDGMDWIVTDRRRSGRGQHLG